MSFNPDSTKPADEVVFSRKRNIHYPPILFKSLSVKRVQSHKHFGLTADTKLNFSEHISSILFIVVSGKLTPRKLPPMKRPSYEYSPYESSPYENNPSRNLPPRKLPPIRIPPYETPSPLIKHIIEKKKLQKFLPWRKLCKGTSLSK